jgi:hypothetical protein
MAGKPKRFINAPTEEHRKVARAIVHEGKSLAEALPLGGFSAKQARKGVTKLLKTRPVLMKAIADEWKKLEKKHGPLINNPQLRERAVLTRLIDNVKMGRDKGVASCKLLGQHRSLPMWTPESMTGIIIIESPRTLPPLPSIEDATVDEDAAIVRHRFFTASPEDVAWRGSPEGQEAKRRLESEGLL